MTIGAYSNPFLDYNTNVAVSGVLGVSGAAETDSSPRVGAACKATPGTKVDPAECQTCKNRKYVDGSNESDVSFKTPGHIDPASSMAVVSGHEQEHGSNAYQSAAKAGGKVLQASVALQSAICPECGRSFIAGGTTTTMISYPNEQTSPYQQNNKSRDYLSLVGQNLDKAV